MTNTGVFATPEELAFLKEKANNAAHTPVIALTTADALAGNDLASLAHRSAQEACHVLALAHGLPEIPGFYGITLDDGEFVRV
jgi:hypothetical protein